MMKNHHFTNTLALTGAMIILLGVSAAARTALADEANTSVSASDVAVSQAAEQSLVKAREANESAVEEAAEAVAKESVQDLDIRLNDPKLMLIARGR